MKTIYIFLFLQLFTFLTHTSSYEIVQRATYFKIHQPKNTCIFKVLGYRKTHEDADRSIPEIEQILQKNERCVAFYDDQWNLLKTQALNTNLKGDVLVNALRNNLDPNTRPKVTKCVIHQTNKLGRSLTAFDASEQAIFTISYDGKPHVNKIKEYIKNALHLEVNLSDFNKVKNEYNKKQNRCLIQ